MSSIFVVTDSDVVLTALGTCMHCAPTEDVSPIREAALLADYCVFDLSGQPRSWHNSVVQLFKDVSTNLVLLYHSEYIIQPEWRHLFSELHGRIPLMVNDVMDFVDYMQDPNSYTVSRKFLSEEGDNELKLTALASYLIKGEALSEEDISIYLMKNIRLLRIAMRHYVSDKDLTTDLSNKLMEVCKFKGFTNLGQLRNHLYKLGNEVLSEENILEFIKTSNDLQELASKKYGIPIGSEELSITMFLKAKAAKVNTEEALFDFFK